MLVKLLLAVIYFCNILMLQIPTACFDMKGCDMLDDFKPSRITY